jgi:hypothetical protein
MTDQQTDPAMARFAIIQLVRWTGVILTLFGILVIAGKLGLPQEAGYVLAVVGIVDALVMPTLLARRWKSPRP